MTKFENLGKVEELIVKADGFYLDGNHVPFKEAYLTVNGGKLIFRETTISIDKEGKWPHALKKKLGEAGIKPPILESLTIQIDSDEASLKYKKIPCESETEEP